MLRAFAQAPVFSTIDTACQGFEMKWWRAVRDGASGGWPRAPKMDLISLVSDIRLPRESAINRVVLRQ
jgi:hypothetical protein